MKTSSTASDSCAMNRGISHRNEARARVLVMGILVATLMISGLDAAGDAPDAEKSGADRPPESRERFSAPTIAVVDIHKVLAGCEQWKDSRDEIGRIQEKAQSTLQKMQRRIQNLKIDYENLPSGTKRKKDKENELRQAMQKYQKAGGEFEKKLNKKRARALSELLREVNRVVTEYAQSEGIDVVLKAGRVNLNSDGSAEATQQALRRASTADVLYAHDRYDISEEIIRLLDARYSAAISDPPTR